MLLLLIDDTRPRAPLFSLVCLSLTEGMRARSGILIPGESKGLMWFWKEMMLHWKSGTKAQAHRDRSPWLDRRGKRRTGIRSRCCCWFIIPLTACLLLRTGTNSKLALEGIPRAYYQNICIPHFSPARENTHEADLIKHTRRRRLSGCDKEYLFFNPSIHPSSGSNWRRRRRQIVGLEMRWLFGS